MQQDTFVIRETKISLCVSLVVAVIFIVIGVAAMCSGDRVYFGAMAVGFSIVWIYTTIKKLMSDRVLLTLTPEGFIKPGAELVEWSRVSHGYFQRTGVRTSQTFLTLKYDDGSTFSIVINDSDCNDPQRLTDIINSLAGRRIIECDDFLLKMKRNRKIGIIILIVIFVLPVLALIIGIIAGSLR